MADDPRQVAGDFYDVLLRAGAGCRSEAEAHASGDGNQAARDAWQRLADIFRDCCIELARFSPGGDSGAADRARGRPEPGVPQARGREMR